MTATDELRRMLDERGVEFQKCDTTEGCFTLWQANGIDAGFDDMERWEQPHLLVVGFTPAQAIDATLGDSDATGERHGDAGTCRFKTVIDKDPSRRHRGNICECDGCGYRCARGFIEDERFKYCPNCGRRIEGMDA